MFTLLLKFLGGGSAPLLKIRMPEITPVSLLNVRLLLIMNFSVFFG